jgi:hypothetical protein
MLYDTYLMPLYVLSCIYKFLCSDESVLVMDLKNKYDRCATVSYLGLLNTCIVEYTYLTIAYM